MITSRNPGTVAFALSATRRAIALSTAALLLVGCSDSTSPVQGDLVGTWALVSVDGVAAPAGTLTWIITPTTITANSDNGDCIEVGTYTVSGNRVTSTTTSFSGPGCGGEVDDMFTFTVTVSGETLTATVTDPELGSATFVFRKI
jgi:hypothetical protein